MDLNANATRQAFRRLETIRSSRFHIPEREYSIFQGTRPEYEVVGDAGNGETALRKAARLKPDVILLDMVMPEMDGAANRTEAVTIALRKHLLKI